MKIGIFGGTFDPPHIGHLILAAEALEQLNLDHVLWVLTTFPPHKKQLKITPLVNRVRMVELAIEDNPRFIISRVEIDREPPHYAVDTVMLLKAQAPQDEFYYLMGMDSFNELPMWHHPADFVKICDGIVVMLRHGETLNTSTVDAKVPVVGEKTQFLSAPIIEISSSDIRYRIKKGIQYRYLVPDKIYLYIQDNRLYKN
jgi:nicotinate-nucleotide adenylyltransferase